MSNYLKTSELKAFLESQTQMGDKLSVVTEFVKAYADFIDPTTGKLTPSFNMPDQYTSLFDKYSVSDEDLKNAKTAIEKFDK